MRSVAPDRGAGVVYTNAWVVDLMLDLVGYDSTKDLGGRTIVEPGCGDGAFLARIVPRLLVSAKEHGRDVESLHGAIRGYELDVGSAEAARTRVAEILVADGISLNASQSLANAWVVHADFLRDDLDVSAHWVVGNPPYIRVEQADTETYSLYRRRWTTMSGRADIYIGFFEAGLSILSEGGKLAFICADRWMHNQYGAPLRRMVVERYALTLLLELHSSDVFDAPVAAYPAITVMEKTAHSSTALVTATALFGAASVPRFQEWWEGDRENDVIGEDFTAATLDGQFRADASWPSGPPDRLRLIADLEARLPSLVEVGVSVGVGLATGADRVYVVAESMGVEPELLKPAVGPADLRSGTIQWGGRWIVSPWVGGELVDLSVFPGAKAYFTRHSALLRGRYVGKRNPNSWWRTIDRPPADDYREPKLIVADINDRIEPILDRDGYWPLHSAYHITSRSWDLEALGGYLLSDIAGAFVEAYSVKMANGHLRVSGQYLKKIRLPKYEDVGQAEREMLVAAFRERDRSEASSAAAVITAGPGSRAKR